ncbi:MAG: DUF2207 family protein [Tepidiformaceae bacterium]
MLFAATSSDTTIKFSGFHGFPVAVLFAGIIVLAIWGLLFAIRYFATFPKLPDAGPESSELGPETPAIANLLVNRWKLTRTAMPATMLDLAARKMLEIDQLGSDHFVVRIKRSPVPDDHLTAYEQQVLDHVHARATGGSAPVEALDLGESGEAERWWKQFDKGVVSDTRNRGLARNRWAADDWLVLGGTLLAGLGLIGLAAALAHVIGSSASASSSNRSSRWDALLGAGFLWFLVMAWMGSLRGIRDTAAGETACARWLGVRNYMRNAHAFENAPAAAVILWDRLLAYGAGLGVAHDAVHDLPFAADEPGSAWSRSTGVWRQIRIEYPHRFGYGNKPVTVFFGGLVRAVWWGGLAFVMLPIVTHIALDVIDSGLPTDQSKNEIYFYAGVFAVVSIVGLYLVVRFLDGAIRLVIAARDLGKSTTYEGAVVKLHEGRAAVDDGKADEIRAWMPYAAGTTLARGMTVRATVSPHLRHVSVCTVLAAAPATPGVGGVSAGGSAFSSGVSGGAIDAAFVKQVTGLDLPAVDPNGIPGVPASLPAGSAVQAFADAAGNRVVIATITLPAIASKMLFAVLSHANRGGSGSPRQAVDGLGDAAYWVGDRALVVQHGQGIVSVDVEAGALSSTQRVTAAKAVAMHAMGVAPTGPLSPAPQASSAPAASPTPSES